MNLKSAFATLTGLIALGCGGSNLRPVTTQPSPEWTITAVSPQVQRSTTNLGDLFDAGTVTPGQTVSSIKFLAVAMNGYDQSIQLSDVSGAAATHVACSPSAPTVTPTSGGAPFTVSFTVPANYPFAGTGASFEGTDATGNKKTVGITFKVRTVSGSSAKPTFKTTDLADAAAISITPIDGFTGTLGITFDRTILSSDGVPSGFLALPNGVSVSAQPVTISGSSGVQANASFSWSSLSAGTYAVIAVLGQGSMAIRVPIEITVTAGSSGTVTFSNPVSVSGGTGAAIRGVSPGGKMAGTDSSGNPVYWSTPTSSPAPVSSSGLGANAGPAMLAINDSGEMVGSAAKGPCYWSSPTADPAYLTLPAGYNGGAALSVNAAGNIVGQAVMSGVLSTAVGVYWSSATATPVVLSNTIGGQALDETLAYAISNTGAIVGTSFLPTGSQRIVVWTSTTVDPVALSPSAGEHFTGMNQVTGAICGWWANTPYVWSPSGYSPTQYLGSGLPNAVGSDGVLVGSDVDQAVATVWPSATASPVTLASTVASTSGWTMQQALFMTTSGFVIGTGQIGGNNGVFVVQRTK